MEMLLSNNADPNAQDPMGCTPLVVTAAVSARCVDVLLVHGANTSLPDNAGGTPLVAACIDSHRLCAVSLLKAGADPNQATAECTKEGCDTCDDQGGTTLLVAACSR